MSSMKTIVIVGSINTDLVMRASRHVLPGETLHANSFEVFTGGKGANQAVAAARLDAKAVMVGSVGSDAFGRERIDALQAAGVQTECIRVVEGSSGMAVIVVSATGENSILILSGANGEMSPADMERHRELILNAGMVLTQLETPLPMLEALAMLCSEHGVPLMLDPAPAHPLSLKLLRHITWLTPNESEAEQLFHRKLDGVDEKCLAKLADEVLADGPQNLLLKLGSRGAYLATRDGQRMLLPAIAVPVVDTTAAGDAFNGAFATRLVAGDEPLEAARFAIAAAALSVTRHGALPSMPDAREVQALLHLQPQPKT
jgi:ribokinase